jgi:DNA polymerase-3 subunit beta
VKLTCDKKVLADALGLAQSAVATKSTLAILGNVMLVAEDGNLELTGTNIDLWVRVRVPAETAETGAITLPARKVTDIVRSISADTVEVTVEGTAATIKGGRATFKVMGLDASDFPTFPTVEAGQAITMRQGDLKDYVKKTLFASSDDITRYALNGICIQMEGNEIRFVATDGYRLAYAAVHTEIETGGVVDVILPSRAAGELSKILGDDDPVGINIGENHISFDCDTFLLVTRQAEGKFPPYREVIPPSFERQITAARAEFLESVRRVALVSDEHSRQIVLTVVPSEITVEAKTADVGEADESFPANYDGDEFKVSYNANYLAEILTNIEGDDLLYELNDPGKQGMFRSTGDEEYFCILMPIKL